MAQVDIVDSSGKKVGTKDVADSVFARSELIASIVHESVRKQRAKKRAGTHKAKTRSEVAGSGEKPWKQKGTGRARAGSKQSPVWVKGGVAHGPKPRDYDFKMNKKEAKRALSDAISAKNHEGKLIVAKDFGLKEIKTKEAKEVISKLGVSDNSKSLVVLKEDDHISEKSFRNIPGVKPIKALGLNVYDVINADYLVLDESVLEGLEARLA